MMMIHVMVYLHNNSDGLRVTRFKPLSHLQNSALHKIMKYNRTRVSKEIVTMTKTAKPYVSFRCIIHTLQNKQLKRSVNCLPHCDLHRC